MKLASSSLFILIVVTFLPPHTVTLLFAPSTSTTLSPRGETCHFRERGEAGERAVHMAGCTSQEEEEEEEEIQICIELVFLLESSRHYRALRSLLMSLSKFIVLPRVCSAPYDCKLRVNFHCWLRLGLQTSTVSPPILALRLSRQRLLPT